MRNDHEHDMMPEMAQMMQQMMPGMMPMQPMMMPETMPGMMPMQPMMMPEMMPGMMPMQPMMMPEMMPGMMPMQPMMMPEMMQAMMPMQPMMMPEMMQAMMPMQPMMMPEMMQAMMPMQPMMMPGCMPMHQHMPHCPMHGHMHHHMPMMPEMVAGEHEEMEHYADHEHVEPENIDYLEELNAAYPDAPHEVKELLKQLMAIDFVLVELNLYLDTHPTDRRALAEHNRHVCMRQPLVKRIEELYGPLIHKTEVGYPWPWLNQPWPWRIEF